jgi:hypothetical protein
VNDGSFYPLRDVKRHDCLRLDREAMQKVNAASQTLAAVLRLAHRNGETFASATKIAEIACRPKRSVERDLTLLVKNNWLKCKGRERRRTPTYIVPKDLLNQKDERRFSILPRWAAWKLESAWAERAVFAAIVSRDSLNEHIGDGEAGENFGRLQYSARLISADTGVSLRSVVKAKAELVALGMVKIDAAELWQEHDGRLRMTPDTLMLNLDYEVPAYLVDRGAKVADCRGAELADCKPLPECKSGGEGVQNWRTPSAELAVGGVQNWRLQLSQLTNSSAKTTSTSTAEPLSASPLACEEEDQGVDVSGDRLAEQLDGFVVHCRNAFGSSCPHRIAEAISSAIDNGCDFPQVYQRAKWAFDNRLRWKAEHRPGAIFTGISEATPDLQPHQGWPYLT